GGDPPLHGHARGGEAELQGGDVRDARRLPRPARDARGVHGADQVTPGARDLSRALDGQVAIVTGAGRGIGRAIAEALAREGAAAGSKPADWDAMLAVNLRAVMVTCRAVLPIMLHQRRGTILNVASVAAQRFIPGSAAYAATKAGVVVWSRVLREEVRAEGVR